MKKSNISGLLILAVLCSLLTTNVNAENTPDPLDKIYIDVHLTSFHKHDGYEFGGVQYETNPVNIGLGITIPTSIIDEGEVDANMSVRFGFFKNSYGDLSLYAGLNPHTEYTNGFGGGVLLGLVNGYDANPDGVDVLPVVMPQLHYIHNKFKTEVGFLATKYNPSISLTVSYSF